MVVAITHVLASAANEKELKLILKMECIFTLSPLFVTAGGTACPELVSGMKQSDDWILATRKYDSRLLRASP
jgi:hypothetical protein